MQYFPEFSLKFHEIYRKHTPCEWIKISLFHFFSKFEGLTGQMYYDVSNLGFPGIFFRTPEGNGMKLGMLVHLDHPQKWLYFSCGRLILILVAFWLSEKGQGNLLDNAFEEWSEIWHVDVSCNLQTWLDFGRGLLIFLMFNMSARGSVPIWLAFVGQRMPQLLDP